MKRVVISMQLFLGLIVFFSSTLQAGAPIWTFTPLTPTTLSLLPDGWATVQYKLTNYSTKMHVLYMLPIPGINQITTAGNCSNPIVLSHKEFCMLNLEIDGSKLQNNVLGGPKLCLSYNSPLCYEPNERDILNITRVKNELAITVTGSPLSLTVGNASGSLMVTNKSATMMATNIHANLSATSLDGNVIQDASQCINLAPKQSCDLIFMPGTTPVTLTSVPIQGDNTRPVSAQMQVLAPEIPAITVSDSPLILQATNGVPLTGSLTITNQSPLVTAHDIAADLNGPLLNAGVSQDASDCVTVLPLHSCNLVFTPAMQAVAATNVPVRGSDTSVTSANIAVNGAPQAPIAIQADNPLALTINSAGAMTIQNNSTTEYALNIGADFTSTALNGLVSETGNNCNNVGPGQACTLTFTAGTTPVFQTGFPIQGDNTSSVNGAISIDGIHIIFVTKSTYSGNLGGFRSADAACNSDSAKPTSDFAAGYTYKALLQGNNATIPGVNYYRPNGKTLIATATSGNLVGASALNEASNHSPFVAWTGGNGNSCMNWTTASNFIMGARGISNSATSSYWVAGSTACNNMQHLYCVSQ